MGDTKFACLTFIITLGLVLLFGGCRYFEKEPKGPAALSESLSKDTAIRLRIGLYAFADKFAAAVAGTANEIAEATRDRSVREMTILWKLRVIPSLQAGVQVDDPRYGLLNAWGICSQMRQYLSDEHPEFGEYQHLATEVARQQEDAIIALAGTLVTPEELAEAKKEIDSFAEGNPIKGRFAGAMIQASESAEKTGALNLTHFLSIPIGGLSESAEAVDRIAVVAGVMAEVVQDLPERTRWQTELLMVEIESLEAVTRALDDFDQVSASFKSLEETSKSLPGEIRQELETLIADTDQAQANLRATLKEARAVLENGTEAATAWKGTADSVNAVVTSIKQLAGTDEDGTEEEKKPESEPPGKPFDPDDYTRAADAIRSGAVEVRGLLDDLASGKLNPAMTDIDKTAESSIDHATAQARMVVDQITYRALLLLGGVFVAMILYRLISSRLGGHSQS